MKNEEINGISSISGGEYGNITVNGIGKIKNSASVENIFVNGIMKAKAELSVGYMEVNGVMNCLSSLKCRSMNINGIINVKKSELNAENIKCDGMVKAKEAISADEINVCGVVKTKLLSGENIKIKKLDNLKKNKRYEKKCSKIENAECTYFEGENVKIKELHADSVILKGKSVVEKLYCRGSVECSPESKILQREE